MNQSKFKPDSTVEYNTFEINKNNDEPKETDKSDKMYYKLTPIPSRNALNTIKEYINQVSADSRPDDKFMYELEKKLDSNEVIFQGFLIAPEENICKQVIGKKGCYFYQTTIKNDIAMIWHDRNQNKFLFWGTKFNLIKSMNIIKHRIDKLSN